MADDLAGTPSTGFEVQLCGDAHLSNFAGYRRSLSDEVGHLLDRYRLVDLALKVDGVGSVGTRGFVALFVGRGQDDVLLLQVREAGRSVLEEHLAPSRYPLSGQRVGEGQRLMQAASDIASYLGAGSNFDRALGEFAVRYSRQNELDYEAFVTEIRDGRLEATELE